MTIAAYVFRADVYCPRCIVKHLPTLPEFDGWEDRSEPPMPTESNLDEMAHAFGFDRSDEWSFDSDDFPKVLFADQLDGDLCGGCGELLGDD